MRTILLQFTIEGSFILQMENVHLLEEMGRLESKLSKSRDNLIDILLDAMGLINYFHHKLVLCLKNIKTETVSDKSAVPDTDNAFNWQIQHLQIELKKGIERKTLSIKRSLMSMRNVLSQHDLFYLPFYELKTYRLQLLQHVQGEKVNAPKITTRLTYDEALVILKSLTEQEIHTEKKVSLMLKNLKTENCND